MNPKSMPCRRLQWCTQPIYVSRLLSKLCQSVNNIAAWTHVFCSIFFWKFQKITFV